MRLFRVTVSFFKDHMQYNQERGCLAMTPGAALDQTLDNLNIHQDKVDSLKTMVIKPLKLEDFSYDAQNMICLGTSYSLKDIWTKRFGEYA